MRWLIVSVLAVCGLVLLLGRESDPVPDPAMRLPAVMKRLLSLHTQLGEPETGDWRESHYEPGQTFREYLDSDPTTPRGERRVIYVQPIGDFTESRRRIVEATADFLSLYFQLPVITRPDWPVTKIPGHARRRHPEWGMEQVLTGYVLDELLSPELPRDAVALLALTTIDLWPGEGWNFVFGEASISGRVGVWSIYRNGDADSGDAEFRLCLLRTIKTATHETGHMFSMLHCTMYECNMCGSNSTEESDRRTLALCPECLAKLCWATGCDPVARYRQLASFCERHSLSAEQVFYERSIGALAGAG